MSWAEGRLSYLAGARIEGRALLRQVEAGTCGAYTRGEVLEELRDLAAEERQLRARCPAPAASRHHRVNSPRERGRKGNQMIKSLLGAGVVFGDIILAMSTPATFRRLHAETHAHQYGTYAVYVAAALLTLWVVMSVAGTASAGKKPSGYTYGGRG
jgi:hypothetical protein